MKKLVIGLLFVAGVAGAACIGPYCYDDTGASMNGLIMSGNGYALPTASSNTIVGLNAVSGLSAKSAGQLLVCTNCVAGQTGTYEVCMSTAANGTSWVLASSTTVACK